MTYNETYLSTFNKFYALFKEWSVGKGKHYEKICICLEALPCKQKINFADYMLGSWPQFIDPIIILGKTELFYNISEVIFFWVLHSDIHGFIAMDMINTAIVIREESNGKFTQAN